MVGVKIGDIHSNDYGLILTSANVSPPKAKTYYVEVPGRDEDLDFTEAFGVVRYHMRELTLSFAMPAKGENLSNKISRFVDDVNGMRKQVVFDNDPDWYYEGRLAVNVDERENDSVAFVQVTANASPYKRKVNETVITAGLSEYSQELNLKNERELVIPSIEVSETATVAYEGNEHQLGAGTWRITGLVLQPGDNMVNVSGSGTITFRYREGRF